MTDTVVVITATAPREFACCACGWRGDMIETAMFKDGRYYSGICPDCDAQAIGAE